MSNVSVEVQRANELRDYRALERAYSAIWLWPIFPLFGITILVVSLSVKRNGETEFARRHASYLAKNIMISHVTGWCVLLASMYCINEGIGGLAPPLYLVIGRVVWGLLFLFYSKGKRQFRRGEMPV